MHENYSTISSTFSTVNQQVFTGERKDMISLTLFGEKLNAEIMFNRGMEFVKGSLLLKDKQQSTTYVQIYLLLQGMELLCKGILLLEDYGKYSYVFPKNDYGHQLVELVEEVKDVYRIKNMNVEFDGALMRLMQSGQWFRTHYNGTIEVFQDVNSYKTDILYKKILQTIRFIQRKFNTKR